MIESSTGYALRCLVLGSRTSVDISADRFAAIDQAMQGLGLLTSIEEKFDILFENFIELETDVARMTIRDMYQSKGTYSDFHGIRVHLSRRVVNLLTSGRLYIDQTSGDLQRAKRLDLHVPVRNLLDEKKQESVEFRFVEALRNIVQHRSLPIDGLTLGGKWVGEDGKPSKSAEGMLYNRHWLDFYLKPETMTSDRKIDESLVTEVRAMGDKISMLPVLRRYMDGIGNLHETIRALTDEKRIEWSTLIGECLTTFAAAGQSDKRPLGLHALRLGKDGQSAQKVAVFDEIKDNLEHYRSRNRSLSNVSTRFMSTHQNSF